MAKHIMLNSDIIPSSQPSLFHNNRGFLFGDSFNFQLRGNSSKAFLVDRYFDYMISTMMHMEMEKPVFLKKSVFATDLELLLQKNRIYKGFSANVSVFRNGGNHKIAQENTISILISADPLPDEQYKLNVKGLKTDIYEKNKIDPYIIKNGYTPVFNFELLAGKVLMEKECDDLLFIDENSNIVKATGSNIIFVKNGHIIVPLNLMNDHHKIFTKFVLETALKQNISIVTAAVKESDLVNLDEIILVDIVNGIRWVVAYKEKRYYNKVSSLLLNHINREII